MANMYINDMSEVWTSIGTSYSAIKMNVTNAASMTTPTISKLLHLQVGGSDKFTVDKNGGVVSADTVTAAGLVSATAPLPVSNDGAALGSASIAWSDLYLATGGVINWNNADVTITHASETLFFAGASSGYNFDGTVQPTVGDAAALGTATLQWSDLYLASGGIINWANGDITLTHSGNTLTLGGGNFSVAGNLTATGTITATSTITGGGFTTAGTVSANTITASGTITAAGSIQTTAGHMYSTASGYFIGHATQALLGTNGGAGGVYLRPNGISSATGQTTVNSAGALTVSGSITSSTGNLSVAGTGTFGGQVNVDSIIQSTDTAMILAAASGGSIYLRPNGSGSAVEQVYINTAGTLITDPTSTGIIVNKPTTSTAYAILAYGNTSSGAVRGYCNNTDYYGIVGLQTGGVAYSFYGSGQAHNSTSWDVSDARAKSNIADCDCLDAYAKVRAIGVKSYRKAAIDEVGWLAQEIELVIPEAVMDVGIPEDDTATRNMVGGDTIKATNDRTMLATLWAAVQHQAEMIEGLEAKIATLEAKGN